MIVVCRDHLGRIEGVEETVMLDPKNCLFCVSQKIMEEHKETFQALYEQEQEDKKNK